MDDYTTRALVVCKAFDAIEAELKRLHEAVQDEVKALNEIDEKIRGDPVISAQKKAGNPLWSLASTYASGNEQNSLLQTHMQRVSAVNRAQKAYTEYMNSITRLTARYPGNGWGFDGQLVGQPRVPSTTGGCMPVDHYQGDMAKVLQTHVLQMSSGFYVSNEPFVFGPTSSPLPISAYDLDYLCRILLDGPHTPSDMLKEYITAFAGACPTRVPPCHPPQNLKRSMDRALSDAKSDAGLGITQVHCVAELGKLAVSAKRRRLSGDENLIETCAVNPIIVDLTPVIQSQVRTREQQEAFCEELKMYSHFLALLHGNGNVVRKPDGRKKGPTWQYDASRSCAEELRTLSSFVSQLLQYKSRTKDEYLATEQFLGRLMEDGQRMDREFVTSFFGVSDEDYDAVWSEVYGIEDWDNEDNEDNEGNEDNEDGTDEDRVQKIMAKCPLPRLGSVLGKLMQCTQDTMQAEDCLKKYVRIIVERAQSRDEFENDFQDE